MFIAAGVRIQSCCDHQTFIQVTMRSGKRIHCSKDFRNSDCICTFDSVHLLKCIRNNWVNLKGQEKTFCYPCFENFEKICFAKFSTLRTIYQKESCFLIKTAPKLTYKTIFPSSLERQQVSLALNVFDESTIAAVREHSGQEDETAKFLEIISTWWTIMNTHNQFMHIIKRNYLQKPFSDEWINKWRFKKNCWTTKQLVKILTKRAKLRSMIQT